MSNNIEVISADMQRAIVQLSYKGRGEIEIELNVNSHGLYVRSSPDILCLCCTRTNSRGPNKNQLRLFPYVTPFNEPVYCYE